MKKLILIIAIVVAPIMSFGQQSVFDKFEDMQGVSSVVVNQKMFKMLADIQINVDDPEANELLAMIEKITSLKVLTTGDENISKQMNESVAKYLKTANLQELMRMKDGDQTVNFYVKEGKDDNHVKELLMVYFPYNEYKLYIYFYRYFLNIHTIILHDLFYHILENIKLFF